MLTTNYQMTSMRTPIKRQGMAHSDNVHRRHCEEKKQFDSMAKANSFAFQNGYKQHGYRCPCCGMFHLTKNH